MFHVPLLPACLGKRKKNVFSDNRPARSLQVFYAEIKKSINYHIFKKEAAIFCIPLFRTFLLCGGRRHRFHLPTQLDSAKPGELATAIQTETLYLFDFAGFFASTCTGHECNGRMSRWGRVVWVRGSEWSQSNHSDIHEILQNIPEKKLQFVGPKNVEQMNFMFRNEAGPFERWSFFTRFLSHL